MALELKKMALFAGVCAAMGLCGCTPAPDLPVAETQKEKELRFDDASIKAGLETLAILTPLEEETHELWSALVLELNGSFNVVTVPIRRTTAPDEILKALDRIEPAGIIVVDNRTVQLYRHLQRMSPNRSFPPAVITLTSFLDRSITGLRGATGIAYEIPAVSGIYALREAVGVDVERVGVVHRTSHARMVGAQARLAAVEKIQLVPVSLGEDPTVEDIEDALDQLVVEEKVDALWVLNDNRLLTPESIVESWLPVLRFRPVPVVVGVSALVNPDVHFGTLAVYPDHAGLGVQVAELVFDLAENDWIVEEDRKVELPLSVKMSADVEQIRDYFGLKPGVLGKLSEAGQ